MGPLCCSFTFDQESLKIPQTLNMLDENGQENREALRRRLMHFWESCLNLEILANNISHNSP